jgi:AraC-like DNA-binding protein
MNNSSGVAAAADGGCGVIRFSTADYAPRERLDAWREICSRTIQNMAIEPLSTERIHVKATMRQMPGLALAAGRSSPLIFQRRREFIDHDDVVFVWGLTSSYQARQFGRTLDMDRGQAVVMAGAEPAFLRVPRLGGYMSLRVPVRCLSPLISDLDAAYGRPLLADSPALQLLTRYLGILQEAGTFAAPELRRQVVTHIHDLLALAVGATQDAAEIAKSRGARAARLRAIKEDIANRLDQPDLSVATTAARQRIKPRYVQRLFECEGTTFTEYVLTQRLALAHRLLRDPRRAGVKISSIALDAGFGDLSYFNRTFRRRYGVAPSELRAAVGPSRLTVGESCTAAPPRVSALAGNSFQTHGASSLWRRNGGE